MSALAVNLQSQSRVYSCILTLEEKCHFSHRLQLASYPGSRDNEQCWIVWSKEYLPHIVITVKAIYTYTGTQWARSWGLVLHTFMSTMLFIMLIIPCCDFIREPGGTFHAVLVCVTLFLCGESTGRKENGDGKIKQESRLVSHLSLWYFSQVRNQLTTYFSRSTLNNAIFH